MKKILCANAALYLFFIFLLYAAGISGIFYVSLILSTMLSVGYCCYARELSMKNINIYLYSFVMAIISEIVFYALTNANAFRDYGVANFFSKMRNSLGVHIYEYIFSYLINFIFSYFIVLASMLLVRNFSAKYYR